MVTLLVIEHACTPRDLHVAAPTLLAINSVFWPSIPASPQQRLEHLHSKRFLCNNGRWVNAKPLLPRPRRDLFKTIDQLRDHVTNVATKLTFAEMFVLRSLP